MKGCSDKISVIVPVFNTEKSLEICVKSILAQTHKNIELILVDDGSSDGSLTIIENLQRKDNRIKYVHISNSGVSCARNTGIDLAEGDYISFADADDFMDVSMLQKLYDAIEREQADVSVCRYTSRNEYEKCKCTLVKKIEKSEMLQELMHPRNEMAAFVWNRLYRTSVIKNNGICFDNRIKVCEDTLFNFTVLQYSDTIVIVDEALYHYKINDCGAMFGRSFNSNKLSANRAYEIMLSKVDNKADREAVELACMLYNVILKLQIYKYRYHIKDSEKLKIKEMLRLNPRTFMLSDLNMKYKIAYLLLII